MYLFLDHFEIKDKSLNKQQLRGAPWFSVMLRPASWCSTVIRTLSWGSSMIRGAPDVINCSLSSPSATSSSIAPGPLVNVLLDASYKKIF